VRMIAICNHEHNSTYPFEEGGLLIFLEGFKSLSFHRTCWWTGRVNGVGIDFGLGSYIYLARTALLQPTVHRKLHSIVGFSAQRVTT
jgi:hypothetical protein